MTDEAPRAPYAGAEGAVRRYVLDRADREGRWRL